MGNYHIEKVMFSSNSGDWRTPKALFDQLDQEFHFTADVCADRDHPLKSRGQIYNLYYHSLSNSWKIFSETNIGFMNPPYGREIRKWIEKAAMETENDVTTVGLLPARTDTAWFWDYILGKFEIRLIRGRIKFSNHKTGAPFPSMIVIFK